jgi:hypothetical protein
MGTLEKKKKRERKVKKQNNIARNNKKKSIKNNEFLKSKKMEAEWKQILEFEKSVNEQVKEKLKDKFELDSEEVRRFITEECIPLLGNDPKGFALRKKYTSMIEQIDSSKNLDFLRNFTKTLKEKDLFPKDTEFTSQLIEDTYNNYLKVLEDDNKKYMHPDGFFDKLIEYEIPNVDKIKYVWSRLVDFFALNDVGYLISLIDRQVRAENLDILTEFKDFGESLN